MSTTLVDLFAWCAMEANLTCHDRTVLLLREIDPDLADTVAAVQCSTDGEVMIGLLGWLPLPERLRLGRAIVVTHADDHCDWNPPPAMQLAREADASNAAWRNPLSVECRQRRDAGIRTWTALGYPHPKVGG